MTEKTIVDILDEIALLLELKGENPFKARAYITAAQTIKNDNIDVYREVKNNTLHDLPGFGEALTKKITEFVETGKIAYHDKLLEEVPPGLLKMTKISGLGPKKAYHIYHELGITTIDELEKACEEDQLTKVKGFGAKTQEMILNSIGHLKASKGKFLQEQAMEEAELIVNDILRLNNVHYASLTGSIRRFCETIKDIYIIAAADNIKSVGNELSSKFDKEFKNNEINTVSELGLPVKIELANINNFTWRLHESTGSEQYLAAFHNLLRDKGFEITPEDLLKNNTHIELKNEAELYKTAGIQYVPPELREEAGAVDTAVRKKIPVLIENDDLKGMLHVHSNWSDGVDSIEDMALAAKEMGFEYIAICDHSRTAAYANGLTEYRVEEQHKEIDALNKKNLGIHILKGIESDILTDGSLDYPNEILAKFDIVVASVHSSFRMSEAEMTKRIIKALENPYTTILGHPTGRLLLARPAYNIDIKAVIDTAVELGKIIEINSNPYRLDLSWENVIYARSKGLKIAINPDSHKTDTLSDIYIGVKVARKGWLTAGDVVNCYDYKKFMREIVGKNK